MLKTGGGSWRRARAYREIEPFSFTKYRYAFVLPYYAEKREDISFSEYGAQRMFDRSDLGPIGRDLASNDKVFFVSNRNDFLLRSQDASWAEALFPNRVHFVERDGHLGNLHRQDMRMAIARFVDTPRS